MKSIDKNILFIFIFLLSIFLYIQFQDKYYAFHPNPIPSIDSLSKSKKPILWVHIPYEYNARNWLHFGSRSSWELNQPYLYITTQSILCKCSDSFTIVFIDDNSFEKILPDWRINMKTIANPLLEKIRILGFMQLLYTYGGLFCPLSFLCMKNLDSLYAKATANNRMFVCENRNKTISSTYTTFSPDIAFCGSTKECPIVLELSNYIREIISTDATEESIFLGEISYWIKSKPQILLVDATEIGVKTPDGNPILLEHLLSNHYLDISPTTYGILIPSKDILTRTNYQWFARLSERQIYDSNTILGKYLLLSSGECKTQKKIEVNERNILEPLSLKPKWVGFWKTPLYPGLYGLKPNFLGDNLLKVPYTGQ